MKKRFISAMALTAFAACASLSLSSCSKDKVDEEHTIVFYHTMGDSLQTTLQTAINSFEAKYPGWTIESSQIGGYDDVRDTIIGDLQGGTQPDLAYCYADHVAQYITTSKVVDMSKYINSKDTIALEDGTSTAVGYTAEEIADFVPGYYSEGKATNFADYSKYGYTEDSMFTLPFVKSTEVLYYNADALIAAGVKNEDGTAKVPTTWDELWDACAKVKAQYPGSTPLGYDSEANWFITTCMQNGWGYTNAQAPHYAFNNDGTKGWLTSLKEKFEAGLFTTQEIYGAYTSNLFVNGAETGSVFSIGSSGGASHQASNKFKWGVAPIPGTKVGAKVNNYAISQGPNLCMFNTSADNANEKELMTWMFVKEILNPTFQCSFSMTSGYNPARQSAFDNAAYQEFLANTSNITSVTANVAKGMNDRFFTSPAFQGSSTARDQVGTALQYAITGEKDVAKALSDAMKKCGA